MSTSSESQYEKGIRTLRTDFRDDLMRFLEVDAHFFGGYVVGWLIANLDVEALGRLVDELDASVRVDGHRVLDRPHHRACDL
jgi:hypothetical protein